MTLEDARPAERLLREPTRDEALQDALQRAKAVVRSLATVLGNHSYLSEQCGIADLYFAPFVTRLDAFGVRRDEIPAAVATWIDRLRDRPSVAAETARWEEAIGLHETGT
jgi:glutathione S-transferase